ERLGHPPDRAIGLSRRRVPDVSRDGLSADPFGGDHVDRRGFRLPGTARASVCDRRRNLWCDARQPCLVPCGTRARCGAVTAVYRQAWPLADDELVGRRARRAVVRASRQQLRVFRTVAADGALAGVGSRRPVADALPQLFPRLDPGHCRVDDAACRRWLPTRRERRRRGKHNRPHLQRDHRGAGGRLRLAPDPVQAGPPSGRCIDFGL
ncbi:MAG: FIG139438: lipoprotein B, partial [uncultured Sphingomonas sp.]